jgi:hypothetical protein
VPKIVPIVEGDGDVAALPALLYKLLHEQEIYDVQVEQPKTANGRDNLTKPGGIERFVQLASLVKDCGAVLILLDADDDCPVTMARDLAERVSRAGTKHPVAVVVANRMYENWLVASLDTLQPTNVNLLPADVEKGNGKEYLKKLVLNGGTYKETTDQKTLTHLLDCKLARSRSRSFCRLCHAVEEAVAHIQAETVTVTPNA